MPSTSRTLTPIAKLKVKKNSITNMADGVERPLTVSLTSVLETFAHHRDIDRAFHAYSQMCEAESLIDSNLSAKLNFKSDDYVALIIVGARIGVAPPASADAAYNLANAANVLRWVPDTQTIEHLESQMRIVDLTGISSRTLGVTAALARHLEFDTVPYARLDEQAFAGAVRQLEAAGVLTFPVNTIDFGDFRRFTPFCPNYGFTRGTPVDRYYLDQFVARVRSQVTGDVLEIGGRKENLKTYGFTGLNSYKVMELEPDPDVDVIGDAHNCSACSRESWDSIILFNVLEHCRCPSDVLRNVFEWLKPGGKVFCAVPNAQRVHRDPKDFWRIYPDAIECMLSGYTEVRIATYGNLLSCHAALSGICAEELDIPSLDFRDERYPVITCAVAQKPINT